MVVALLLTMLIMGLISRTLPQFNVLAVGFGMNAMVMLGVMLLCLGIVTRLFQDQSFAVIDMIRPALVGSPP